MRGRALTGTRAACLLAALALLAAACNSTTRLEGADSADEGEIAFDDVDLEATDGGGDFDLAATEEPTADSLEIEAVGDAAGGGGAANTDADADAHGVPDVGQSAGSASSVGETGPRGDPGDRRTGRGVTPSEIRIGFQVSEDLQAGFAAVGAGGDAPDERRIAAALVEWVNENGGLAGRKVVPVFHGTNAVSGTWSTQAQAACSTFTEDNEVFVVVSSNVGGSDAMLACTASKQTPLIEQNLWLFDQPYWDRYAGFLYQPGKMRADRWVAEYGAGLARAGFFEGGTLGVARFDAPVFTRMTENVLKPTLARHGVEIDQEAILNTPQSASDFGRMNGEINNAILRFRSQGVDRVLFIENAGILPFFWMPAAESQGYRPRYGLASNSIPTTMQGQAPARQLSGAMGVGWTPPNDVGASERPANPAAEKCVRIMREKGIPPHWAGFYTHSACEAMFFLQVTLDRTPEFTPRGFRAAVEGLGTRHRGPFAIASRFGPSRHDGGAGAQLLAFDDSCTCFKYRGRPWDVP